MFSANAAGNLDTLEKPKVSHFIKKKRFIVILCLAFMVSMSLTACGKPTKSANAGDATPQPDTVTWTLHSDCSLCHSEAGKSARDSKMLVTAHAESGVVKCSLCHDKATLEAKHANVTAVAQADPDVTISKDLCLTCHQGLADLAKVTASSTVLKDENGLVVNPHDVPRNASHAEAGVTECTSCHPMHKDKTAAEFCAKCHHKGVFGPCSSCHKSGE